jgi:hypothetical protein
MIGRLYKFKKNDPVPDWIISSTESFIFAQDTTVIYSKNTFVFEVNDTSIELFKKEK